MMKIADRNPLSEGFNQRPEIEIVDNKTSAVRYVEHGCPSKLIRWHLHEEFELHLVVTTKGKMFVGDYIGSFEPGNLVLTGPLLPHNWISDLPENHSVPLRDRVIQFNLQSFEKAYDIFPECREAAELLERAKYGIEFLDFNLKKVEKDFIKVRDSTGLERLSAFFHLMDKLRHCPNYRLLNTMRMRRYPDDALLKKVNIVVDYISRNYSDHIELQAMADLLKMSPSYFSRFFHKTTGHRFNDFLNRLRIARACDLLAQTEKQVSEICYEVGFNNLSNFNRRFLSFKSMAPSDYRVNILRRHTNPSQ